MLKKNWIVLLFGLVFVTIARSQISIENANEVFEQIPAEQRSRLTERLNLFIQLEKKKDWDESYKMISDSFKGRIRGGYSLRQYKADKNIKISKFIPQSLTPINDQSLYTAGPFEEIEGQYFIEGCGSSKSGTGKSSRIIEAYWEKGNWYFSFMQALGMHEKVECSSRKRKKK